MFNPSEYCGRIKHGRMLSVRQRLELINYEIRPYHYTQEIDSVNSDRYNPEECSKCSKYKVCGRIHDSIESGELEIIHIVNRPPISMN